MCAIRSQGQRGIDLITGRRRARDSLLFSRVRFAYQKAVHSFSHSFCPFCFRLFLHISLEISFVFLFFSGVGIHGAVSRSPFSIHKAAPKEPRRTKGNDCDVLYTPAIFFASVFTVSLKSRKKGRGGAEHVSLSRMQKS